MSTAPKVDTLVLLVKKRLMWKWLTATNTLAYYTTELNTTIRSLMLQIPGDVFMNILSIECTNQNFFLCCQEKGVPDHFINLTFHLLDISSIRHFIY